MSKTAAQNNAITIANETVKAISGAIPELIKNAPDGLKKVIPAFVQSASGIPVLGTTLSIVWELVKDKVEPSEYEKFLDDLRKPIQNVCTQFANESRHDADWHIIYDDISRTLAVT
jgi:hypothetical protein